MKVKVLQFGIVQNDRVLPVGSIVEASDRIARKWCQSGAAEVFVPPRPMVRTKVEVAAVDPAMEVTGAPPKPKRTRKKKVADE